MAGKKARHMVHGEWLTVAEVAARVGVTERWINRWRYKHRRDGKPALVEEAYEWHRAANAGEIKRYAGRVPRRYWVRGKTRTIREAAELIGVAENVLRKYVYHHKCSVDTALKAIEEREKRRAEREILAIIFGRQA